MSSESWFTPHSIIIKEQNVRCGHLSFRFSILCNYFAHENRNYPFCSPAFVLRFYLWGTTFIPTGHSNCFYTKNQFLIYYLFDFSPSFFRFLSVSLQYQKVLCCFVWIWRTDICEHYKKETCKNEFIMDGIRKGISGSH